MRRKLAGEKVAAYVQTATAGRLLCRIPAPAGATVNQRRRRARPHNSVRACRQSMQTTGFELGLASLQRAAAAGKGLPPVERWNPAYCGEIDIRIARDGTWFHQGSPIGRREIVRLFSTILRKDGQDYFLVTPVEKMRIRVDDAPFIAVLLDAVGEGHDQRLTFTTNVGDEVTAGPQNPIRVHSDARTGAPAPYVHVRNGMEARIARTVFYQLAELAVAQPGTDQLGVWSGGVLFVLGPGHG